MGEGRNQPPGGTSRVERRASARRRRAPLPFLVVPVVLVALGAGLILLLRGGGGNGIPFLGGSEDETVPAFGFKLGKVEVVPTSDRTDVEELTPAAEAAASEVAPVLDELYTAAFLDPARWREGDYEPVWELFDEMARPSAQQGVETLTLGASAGDVYESVTPRKGSLSFRVLFDPQGGADTVVVRVRFYATGERKDGTYVAIVSHGQLFLRDTGEGWRITAFSLKRNDRETEPPTPAPSGGTSASPSP